MATRSHSAYSPQAPGRGRWLLPLGAAAAGLLGLAGAAGWAEDTPPAEPAAKETAAAPAAASATGQPNMDFFKDMFGAAVANSNPGGRRESGKGSAIANLPFVRRLLAKERNITLTQEGDRIFIDGHVTSEGMRKRVERLLKVYENLVDLTEFQPDEDTLLADVGLIKKRIEDTLNRDYDPRRAFVPRQEVGVEIVNDHILITGELNSPEDVEQAVRVAGVHSKKVINDLKLRHQMIEITAIFAKHQNKNNSALGTKGTQSAIVQIPRVLYGPPDDSVPVSSFNRYWGQSRWGGAAGAAGFNNSATDEADGLLAMDFLKGADRSAVLARPHLSTLNGQSVSFLAGGEKAIQTYTQTVSEVEYKKYGVILTATPTLISNGQLRLHVELEFSLPEANGLDFISFQHKGDAILRRDEGLVLSGMVNEARSRGLDRTPYASQVPILGFFFGHREDSADHEDLVLVMAPNLPRTVTGAPYADADRTAQTVSSAMWIYEPDEREKACAQKSGREGEYWSEGDVILQPSEQELKLNQSAAPTEKAAPRPPAAPTPTIKPSPAARAVPRQSAPAEPNLADKASPVEAESAGPELVENDTPAPQPKPRLGWLARWRRAVSGVPTEPAPVAAPARAATPAAAPIAPAEKPADAAKQQAPVAVASARQAIEIPQLPEPWLGQEAKTWRPLDSDAQTLRVISAESEPATLVGPRVLHRNEVTLEVPGPELDSAPGGKER